MAISQSIAAHIYGDIELTKIQILSDFIEDPADPSGPVETGLIVSAYITQPDDGYLAEVGEAWYVRPDTGEDWLSLPGDYEVIP